MTGSRRIANIKAKAKIVDTTRAAVAQVAVGYVRVSTDEQAATGHGLATQETAIRAFALSQGYELAQVIVDGGVSGSILPSNRPGFRQVIELAEAGAFSVLLVWKFDRLARRLAYAITTANDLQEKHGVHLRSVTEPIDTATPMGRTLFAVLAGMAEQERSAIIERTILGRKEKAKHGGIASGVAPLGYDLDKDGGIIPNEDAGTVRRIFAARAEGRTFQDISDSLNADQTKTARGGKWWPATVAYIVSNPKYRGQVEYFFQFGGGEADHVLVAARHEPLIEAQKLLI